MPENKTPAPGRTRGNGWDDQPKTDRFSLPRSPTECNSHHFDGTTFNPALDGPRLCRQLDAVRSVMASGAWLTLRQISIAAKCSEASASARLRDLRKQRFGGHMVARKRIAAGLFAYRLRDDGEGVPA